MKLSQFEYLVPETAEEALALRAEYTDSARPLAGGQSLIPMMAFRLASPAALIDLNRVIEWTEIESTGNSVRVGAMVRERAAERSETLTAAVPLLSQALPFIGHEAIRTRGTMGGSLAHGDPASELPAVAVAVGATMTAQSLDRGVRELTAEEFFVTHYTNGMEDDELLTHVTFPVTPPGTGVAFEEMARRHGDFAMVGVATMLHVTDGKIDHARIVLTGVADTPFRSRAAEGVLIGTAPDAAAFEAAASATQGEIDPPSDLHGTTAYRRHVAGRVDST